jgi:hypothetical protein
MPRPLIIVRNAILRMTECPQRVGPWKFIQMPQSEQLQEPFCGSIQKWSSQVA